MELIQENIQDDIQKEFNVLELNMIRDSIEKMEKMNQIEVLRILHKYPNITLNENNYGIHINLTELDTNIMTELKHYINYIRTQENNLKSFETQKDNMRSSYFVSSKIP
jgi:hypothetical protein